MPLEANRRHLGQLHRTSAWRTQNHKQNESPYKAVGPRNPLVPGGPRHQFYGLRLPLGKLLFDERI